ncbi:MAG: stage IV sporulation protein FB [Rhodothermales bacterium]|jgi:stage IV sporulation protein FB
MLQEPPRSPYDLVFPIADIPVRIHWTFWLVAVFMGMNGGGPVSLLMWVLAVFVSILAHELGHALTAKAMAPQARQWIVLYSFGGLAMSTAKLRRPQRILQVAAGPLAGLLLGVISFLAYQAVKDAQAIYSPLGAFLNAMMFINFIWSFFNLVPVLPLDGGHIARELLCYLNERKAEARAQFISMISAAIVAVIAFMMRQPFAGVFMIFMIMSSFQAWQLARGRGGAPRRSGGQQPDEDRESWQRKPDWWKKE